jgi:20S proteasome subunit beta 4
VSDGLSWNVDFIATRHTITQHQLVVAMDIILGLTTKDSVIIATSKAFVRGISVLKTTDDKTLDLNDHNLMAFSGEAGDAVNFAEYLQANIKLYGMRHGTEMSGTAIASFTRSTLATALRSRVSIK